MRRLVVFSACIFFAAASFVSAETINVTQVRTAGAAYDEVDLYIQSITGTEIPPFYYGPFLTGLKGTFSLAGAGTSFYLSTATTWYNKTTNNVNEQDGFGVSPPAKNASSWINFAVLTSDPRARFGGSGNLWSTFSETLSVTAAANAAYSLCQVDITPGGTQDDGDGYGFDNTLFAKIWVPHAAPDLTGATIFDGLGNYAMPLGDGYPGQAATTVIIVPEPSTLPLLASGLFSLFVYTRRKRSLVTIASPRQPM
jgi:hypothetical protein